MTTNPIYNTIMRDSRIKSSSHSTKDNLKRPTSKTILVTPLNWGLGHATRCIPIIRALIRKGYTVIIASDGDALYLLQKEFPNLTSLSLPGYDITYAKKGKRFRLKLLSQLPHIFLTIQKEHRAIREIVKKHNIDGIISDNRLGAYCKDIPTVFLTHQLQIFSGNTSWITTKMHQKFIKKFNECWVPDREGAHNLSGKLGHPENSTLNIKYIGTLSRFHKKNLPQIYDVLILLSGPEPQRTLLEEQLRGALPQYKGRVLFVRGMVEKEVRSEQKNSVTFVNYLTSDALESAINQSKVVLSRSGYTTIMDLAQLGKKAFFIPTPGQYEQEYLAKYLDKKRWVPHAPQDKFRFEMLQRIPFYKGLQQKDIPVKWSDLFDLFERKRKL